MDYIELFAIALFFISLFVVMTTNNIIKSIVFILLMQTAVIMFWLILGAGVQKTPKPPIIYDTALLDYPTYIADPLPQAISLTAIIIGFSVIAVVITMLNTLFRRHSTVSWEKMKKMELEGQEQC